jgi:hypothetical protein
MKWLLLTLACVTAFADEYSINLKDPVFTNGTLSTEHGGIITGKDLRIQARHIEYVNRVENGVAIKKISAEGDLLLEHGGRIFIGKKLQYDLGEKIGTMVEGRTSTDYWFVGGDEIELLPNGNFWVSNAYLTTVEGQNAWWELRSSHIDISNKSLLTANNIKFNFFDVPFFWLPHFKFNLKVIKEPPIKYKFIWDQVLKQKVSLRYELYSNEVFDLFGRFDYRIKRGPGAAIETDYHSRSGETLFQTKSYGAWDKVVDDEHGTKRFRLQGLYTTRSSNEKTHLYAAYDKLSDNKMPQDFKSDDFELNTQKRTILWITHWEKNYFARMNLQPRINRFQSINQQLPLITFGLRPFPLGKSGIVFDNWFSAGYLDYVYSPDLHHFLHSSHAARCESQNTLYRHFQMGPLDLTPYAGFVGIFYSNTNRHHPAGQAIGSYGFDLHSSLYKTTSSYKHLFKPYIRFNGLTSPTTPNRDHFIFSIEDGYAEQNLFRPGLYQAFYPRGKSYLPNIALDLYANVFLGPLAFHRTLPKLYTTWEFDYTSWRVKTDIVYNLQEILFDRTNIKSEWTISENFAFALEFRHRSKFDWRKADHSNFIVDIDRPIEELLHSPLSDGRNTLLSSFQIRLHPLWTLHMESHHGWGRKNESSYNAYEIKFSTLLTGKWLVQFGVKVTPGTKVEWVIPSIKLLDTKF